MNTPSCHMPFNRSTAAGGGALKRRVLAAGFWFFLAKGLLWLAAPTAIWLSGS